MNGNIIILKQIPGDFCLYCSLWPFLPIRIGTGLGVGVYDVSCRFVGELSDVSVSNENFPQGGEILRGISCLLERFLAVAGKKIVDPVFVLDHRLPSSSTGPSKCGPRSRLSMYVFRLLFYAGSVALIFDPKSVLVPPQYHFAFDHGFLTVPYLNATDIILPQQSALVKNSSE